MCLASIGSLVEEPYSRSVYVSVPPRTEFLALLRTVTGGVATRMQLPLDSIDDLRLAVDEAVAFLLTTDRNAARVEMRLDPADGGLTATIGTDSPIELWPPRDYRSTLPWQVISGLTDAASITRSERGTPTIVFVKRTLDARAI
jgi:serine/threonine-protein kinase RsbW